MLAVGREKHFKYVRGGNVFLKEMWEEDGLDLSMAAIELINYG